MLFVQGITRFVWLIIKKVIGFAVMVKQRGEFRLSDIMHSSHNVHLSNQNMKCSPRVALYRDIKCF